MATLSSAVRAPRLPAAGKQTAQRATTTQSRPGSIDLQHVLGTGLAASRLDITQPTDPTEVDADRQAQRALSAATPSCCSACAAGLPCGADLPAGTLARKAIPGAHVADPFVRHLGAGRPLDPPTRAFFEPRFDRDFAAVRLHTGPAAQRAAAAVGAQAFTVGPDIAIGDGVPNVGSAAGQRLLAHELAHIVQQQGRAPAIRRVGPEDPPFGYTPAEREILRREAERKAAEEARHQEWEKSHKEAHGQFLRVGATTTLTQDIATTREQLVEQRMALLAVAAKRTQPDPFAPYLAAPPRALGQFGGTALPAQQDKVVIPPELPRAWANAHTQTVVVRALLDGNVLTDEDSAVGQAAYLEFYKLLIPIAEVVDRKNAELERMSQSLADAFDKQNRVPCPNCHTPNPPTRPVLRAPPPSAPYLQESLEQLLRVNATTWLSAMSRFEGATKTMDALVLTTVPADHPAAQGFTFARDLLERQEELQKTYPDAIRIQAVFYPEDKWIESQTAQGKDVEIASGIPWYFYLTHTPMPSERVYPEGFSWTLRDITSPKRPEVSYEPGDIERYLRKGNLYATEVPDTLFEKLNNKLVFPKGMLYWRFPNGHEGSLQTTEPWSLSDWLGAIGMSLAALALLLGTAGLATPAVLAGLGIASAAFSVGSTLADLKEKSELGILTQEDKNKAILFIAADIASALSAGLGHAARELGAAAAAAGRVSRLAIVVQRTATAVGAIDKALGTAVVVTMTADFVSQYEAIQYSNLPPEEREKALKELTASALFTGAIILAPHAAEALGPKTGHGQPAHDPLGLGGEPVQPITTISRGPLEPQAGWSRPRPEAEFTNWSTKQETLTPENAAHELQIAQTSGTRHETPNDKEFKQEIQIEGHTWKEERAAEGGWCRFTTKRCYRPGSLTVGAGGKGERVTASTAQDITRLRAELGSPPALTSDQARLDWADYRFYAERRLRMIEDALKANRTPPEPPRTFASFKREHPPGSVVRNEIQGSRFEARSRGALEKALGPERAEAVLEQPHLSESTAPTVGKGELTRPEHIFVNPDGRTATAISNKSRESMTEASTAQVRIQVIRDLEEAVEKYTGVRQVRRTGQQVEVTRIWLLYDAEMVPAKHRPTVRKTVAEFADQYLETGLKFEVGIF
jgi:hypothetical protein